VYSALVASVILVDWSLSEPVYAQIARQVRAQIASGALPAGSLLPPVRTLASDLGVNLNTVARAYRLLATEGFLNIEEREGVRVMAPARHAEATAVEPLDDELTVLLARMRQAGLSPADIRKRVARALDELI
jgi:GntR family transcriptional regulator